jgi:CRISPR-associated protein Cas1
VSLVVVNARRPERTAIMHGRNHNDVARRLRQYQWYQDEGRRSAFSVRIVRAKVRAQHRLLAEIMEKRPDLRKPLFDGAQRLERTIDRLGTTDALDLDTIRGLEGAAAAAYFEALAPAFPPDLNFTGRNRRPPRDPVNVCLSLGYTLIHSEAVLACRAAGLEPLLGFYHEPEFGRDSLAADCIEPLRPRVDRWVWNMVRHRNLRAEHFTMDKGACLLGKAGRSEFYTAWEVKARQLRRWLRREVGAIARTLAKDGEFPFRSAIDDCEECEEC